MMAVRILLVACCCVTLMRVDQLSAGELNDSMQHFHRGDFKSSYDGFTKLIQEGQQDARIYYYRGLIAYRFGDRQAATRDFQAAANIEAAGQSVGVSESLERIQGTERLALEKYRTMARLAARNRSQPVAPRAVPRTTRVASAVQLASATTPLSGQLQAGQMQAGQYFSGHSATPSFRLASEVPMRRPVSDNPFKDDKLVPQEPKKPSLVATPTSSGQPVGTGVPATDEFASNDEETAAESDNVFGDLDMDDSDLAAEFGDLGDDNFSDGGEAGSGEKPKTSAVFGAIFRAFGSSTIPKVSPQGLIPNGIPVPGMQPPPPPPGMQPPPPGGDPGGFPDDGFSDEGFGDNNEPF